MQPQIASRPGRAVYDGFPDPNRDLLDLIRGWRRKVGQALPPRWVMSRLDEPFAKFCAEIHDRALHAPHKSRTLESYRVFIAEIGEQFQALVRGGYLISLWQGEQQPYRNSQEMRADDRNHRRLFVYPTSNLSPDHRLADLAMTGWCWNDIFRGVHDLVAHAATGFQFGPVGEENAFRFHATIFSAPAIPALAAETRLQNCWVNYGPHSRDKSGMLIQAREAGYVPPASRPYAAQKAFSPMAGSVDCALWKSFSTTGLEDFSPKVPASKRERLLRARAPAFGDRSLQDP